MIGFTCCVNYSDFLKITYPLNRYFLDELIVVTSLDDIKTIRYCEINRIKHIKSDCYKEKGIFNRSAMLNLAIEKITKEYPNDWYLSFDCDTVISYDNYLDNSFIAGIVGMAGWAGIETRQSCRFEKLDELDRSKIYGCPRKMITDMSCQTIQGMRDFNGEWFRYPYNLCAYLGYFQMFADPKARFNESYVTVNNSDTAFLDNNFGINSARTLSDVVCYHLGEHGTNWEGRKSKEWEGEIYLKSLSTR